MPIDWYKSMSQTYEFKKVNTITWKDDSSLDHITSCNIRYDLSTETITSASFECTDDIGECYIRTYLVVNQNGVTERVPLGTHLVQTPGRAFDGKSNSYSIDAYSPLLELKEKKVPLGYSVLKGSSILKTAYEICNENMRAPVIKPSINENDDKTLEKNFVSNADDTWLSFVIDLLANAKYELSIDELGVVMFSPKQEVASLVPIVEFNDDYLTSIMLPDISIERDLYGIPNSVEVLYSYGSGYLHSFAYNNDPNSPISIPKRGRVISYRDTSPSLYGEATQSMVDEYAERLLKDLSTIQYKVNYSRGYYPVRVGDCIMLNYKRSGVKYQKVKIISQSISCETGCIVSETGIYTDKLYGGE